VHVDCTYMCVCTYVRQSEIHTPEPLVPEFNYCGAEFAVANLKI
jgi:hypothetical protein